MSKDKATQDSMNDLHGQLAEILAAKLTEGGKGTAAIANVARQFLKDNNVTADIGVNKPLQELTKTLPFAGGERKLHSVGGNKE